MTISFKRFIGIEFRENSLSLVSLKKGVKGFMIEEYAHLDESPWNIDGERLKEFIYKYSNGRKEIILGIPRSMVLMKILEIPTISKEEVSELLEYEIERHIPFPIDGIYYDFDVIEKQENSTKILFTVVKKEYIDEILNLFDRVEINPREIDITSNALFNIFLLNYKELKDKVLSLINLGNREIELNIIKKSSLVLTRSIPIIENNSITSSIVNGLKESLEYLGDDLNIETILLSGLYKSHLLEDIKKETGIETYAFNPLNRVYFEDFNPTESYKLSIPIGLALKGFKVKGISINLLPKDMRKTDERRGFLFTAALSGLSILLVIGIFVSNAIIERMDLKRMERIIDTYRPIVNSIEEKKNKIDIIDNRIKILRDFEYSVPKKIDLILELSELIPNDIWLVNLEYRGNEIIMDGYAESASKLITILDSSQKFSKVEFVGPITRGGRRGKERFRLRGILK